MIIIRKVIYDLIESLISSFKTGLMNMVEVGDGPICDFQVWQALEDSLFEFDEFSINFLFGLMWNEKVMG